jgi:hypothetical protein
MMMSKNVQSRIFSGGLLMSALGNLTDHVLATIANILDHSDARREPREVEQPRDVEKPESLMPTMAEGYTKIGPGPLAAMRLKWTVRRNVNDEYFVDEMIGENLACTVAGPMAKEAAVKFVDDREAEARRRFEQLRSEMTGHAADGARALRIARKRR